MDQKPVEDNFVTRFVLGIAVITAMMIGGQMIGVAFRFLDLPYGAWIGAPVGALFVFVVFAALYRRHDGVHNAE